MKYPILKKECKKRLKMPVLRDPNTKLDFWEILK